MALKTIAESIKAAVMNHNLGRVGWLGNLRRADKNAQLFITPSLPHRSITLDGICALSLSKVFNAKRQVACFHHSSIVALGTNSTTLSGIKTSWHGGLTPSYIHRDISLEPYVAFCCWSIYPAAQIRVAYSQFFIQIQGSHLVCSVSYLIPVHHQA